MTSATVVDDDEKTQFSSQSKEVVSEDDEDTHASLQSEQAESGEDSYVSDSGDSDSDCSVTSGLTGHSHKEIAFFTDRRAGHSTADESGETTWTDEKHSSYLDSMEATFVQKMYDKEYCSLEVCGHSSHSSLTLDQECVESQPFCLNMRKPLEQKIAGLLTFRAPARPFSLVPSMLTSPWIQHFKSQRNVSLGDAHFQDKDAQPLHAPISTKVLKTASTTDAHRRSSEDSPQSSHDSAYRKRDSARVTQAGDYKKQKSQHSALSHMDILMEQQYNLEQLHRKMEANKGTDDRQEESREHLANNNEQKAAVLCVEKVALLENTVLKEKQELGMSNEIKPPPVVVNGVFSQKLDQVVPSFQSVGEEDCAKILAADLHGDKEGAHITTMLKHECRSGSKIWTWGVQGPRYHVVKQTSTHTFHS